VIDWPGEDGPVSVEASGKGLVRFGAFEVDLRTGEVRKHRLRMRLQDQPLQVLVALIDRPGEIVTRDELVRRLWADGTVIDYEGGLNAAVTRLRQALSDSAGRPRYIETVARRGYRWIAPVERDEERPPATVDHNIRPTQSLPAPRAVSKLVAAGVAAAAISLGAVAWWALVTHNRPEHAITVLPLTTGLGAEANASFSPDGTLIVYEWEQEDHRRHIYMKEVGAGDPVPLTSGPSAEYGPEWSPDGRLIAFLRANGPGALDLYVVPPLGGVERKIATMPCPDPILTRHLVRRMAWTADANHVVVSVGGRRGQGEGLLLVSIADGSQRWLTDPNPDANSGDREPAVSPDGRQVAFVRGETAGIQTIFLLPLTADLRPAGLPQPLPGSSRSRSPAWSRDGKEILFTGMVPGLADGGLAKLRIAGGAPVRIPLAGVAANTPTVSRTGRVAFTRIRLESGIWQQEVSYGSRPAPPPVRLTKVSTIDGNADYSPDGRRITFASDRSGTRQIWTCARTGAPCQALTSFAVSYGAGSPRWSPDGRQIAFDSGANGRMHIYVVDANGGSPRRLTDDQTGGVVPRWSHDGAWIYFSSSRSGANEIWKIPSAGGAPLRVTRSGGFVAMEAPAANALFYTKAPEEADLFRSDMDGSHERLVLRGVAKRGFVVTSDRIYYLHEDADASPSLRVFMLPSADDQLIARIVEPIYLGLGLSPDGGYLIYTQIRIASNLMLAEGVFR
jgi:Tol biopolymer transport system component/DNA-binding winged helix-turn-helix (wHTH) protein